MYRVNHTIIRLIQTGFLFGMPLLTSFIIPSLHSYRYLCIGILVLTFYWNHYYPDRIAIDESTDKVHIKLFLRNEWLMYNRSQVRFVQTKRWLAILIDDKSRFRIVLHQMPTGLYEYLYSYCELEK